MLKKIKLKKRTQMLLLAVPMIIGVIVIDNKRAEAWQSPTYGGEMAGYHIYLRKTSGSTLLGIMSLTRNSVGVYNDFTANVNFMNTVHGYVWTKSIVYGNHLYDNGLLVGDTLHVPYIFTGYEYNANEDPSVYGYMYFENY